ncbi:MAG: hypothetical protein DI598_03915 [Pseudopedobacter saltans]|uniref:DUF2752 domain-containing protein n=1 Tax=Pseudopedobacter saltans TaxID=151895 RepID=A0A2W5FBV9_9SPHI|nr:MAG: hypothetical protein DI598_03915 [Pseudopedobacter saltans]
MQKILQNIQQNQELYSAIKIVWAVITTLSILVLIVVFCCDENTVLKSVPTCTYKLQGRECILCGCTRAFLQIKHLSFDKAFRLNKLSILLFVLLLANIFFFLKNIFTKDLQYHENC